jgi:hypothetical protein
LTQTNLRGIGALLALSGCARMQEIEAKMQKIECGGKLPFTKQRRLVLGRLCIRRAQP